MYRLYLSKAIPDFSRYWVHYAHELWLNGITLCLGRAELDSDLHVAAGSVQDSCETILHHMLIKG